jgi:hypothetical protein
MNFLQTIRLLFQGQVHLIELHLAMLNSELRNHPGYKDNIDQLRFSVAVLKKTLALTEKMLIKAVEKSSDDIMAVVITVSSLATEAAYHHSSPASQVLEKSARQAFIGGKTEDCLQAEEEQVREVRTCFEEFYKKIDEIEARLVGL